MDPYIEQSKIWPDFHNSLADEIRARLNAQIRPAYFARLIPYTTYEVIEIASARLQSIRPDVGVWQRPGGQRPLTTSDVTLLDFITPAPIESVALHEVPLELFSVEIRRAEDELLVTAIEILSPVNKQPNHEAYAEYLRKRRDLMNSTAHFMEIDLLRAGKRPPLAQSVPLAAYYITLSRANRRPVVEVWPIALQERLPILPVPLSAPDDDVALNLGGVVTTVYERGGYDVQIDYGKPPPPPPLLPKERKWVIDLLRPLRAST
jgi:hypothetical protein